MIRMKRILRVWLYLAAAVTALCVVVYATAQQLLRQGANDPQIQMAEDAAAALNAGASASSVLPAGQVELSASLAPFLIVYENTGKPAASSARLNGSLPDYPLGALQAATKAGENRVTWQPNPGVRIASVVVPFKEGFVVAGRSLKEAEDRVSRIGELIALMWFLSLIAVLVVAALGEFLLGDPQVSA
ncbi:MAG TPA: hypothetical protein VF784_05980 [Anaerolineales bacterium]